MVQLDRLFGLVQRVLMPVDLGKDSTELHLESGDNVEFSHSVANGFFFDINTVRG